MKKVYSLLFFCVSICLIAGAQAPTITSVAPMSGAPGTPVTITGTNFSNTASQLKVMIGNVKCAITAASTTSLTVTIPLYARFDFLYVVNTATNLSVFSPKKFIVTYTMPAGQSIGTSSFDNAYTLTTGGVITTQSDGLVDVADLDDDGKIDIARAFHTSPTLRIFSNQAASGGITASSFVATDFTTQLGLGSSTNVSNTNCLDLNNDGKTDVVVGNYGTSPYYSVLANTSTPGSLSFATGVLSTNSTDAVISGNLFGDINADGKIDMLRGYNGSASASQNISSGGTLAFATGVSIPKASLGAIFAADVVDFDGDGKPDYAFGDFTGKMQVFLNTTTTGSGTFSFTAGPVFNCSGAGSARVTSVEAGDLDGDGDMDIMASDRSGSKVYVFRNVSTIGTLAFDAPVQITFSGAMKCAGLGDIDGDGDLDILGALATTKIGIAINNSTLSALSFATPVDIPNVGSNDLRTLKVCDIDGDTYPDIVASANSNVYVIRNKVGDLTKFYSTSGGTTFTSLSDWTSSSNGIGGTAPTDFGSDKEFILANRGSYTLDNSVTFSGRFNVNGNIITLGNFNITTGQVLGAGSSAYVKTNGTGKLIMNVGSATVNFPVGNTTYNPVSISNSGATDNFSVSVIDNVTNDGTGSGTTTGSPVVNRTWLISEAVAGGSNITITPQWNAADEINSFTRSHVFVAHHDGSIWTNYLGGPATGAPAANGSNPYTISQSGITSFSPFTVASSGGTTLPVHFISTGAALVPGGSVLVSWRIGAATDHASFTIERSSDGRIFFPVGAINVTDPAKENYSWNDYTPAGRIVYYRIKETDNDGRSVYSVISIVTLATGNKITSYPNPVLDRLIIYLGENITTGGMISITDISGREIYNKYSMTGNKTLLVATSQWPAGLYLLKVTAPDGVSLYSEKILKQ